MYEFHAISCINIGSLEGFFRQEVAADGESKRKMSTKGYELTGILNKKITVEEKFNREQSLSISDTDNIDQYVTMECGSSEEEDETNILEKEDETNERD